MSTDIEKYPIIPLRNSVLFPGNIIPILIRRSQSLSVIDHLLEQEKKGITEEVVLLTQKDPTENFPGEDDLYKIGTRAKVLKIIQEEDEGEGDDTVTAVIQGISRVSLQKVLDSGPFLEGNFLELKDSYDPSDPVTQTLFEDLLESSQIIIGESSDIPKESLFILEDLDTPSELCDFIAGNLDLETKDLQSLLEILDVRERLSKVSETLDKHVYVAKIAAQIKVDVLEDVNKNQKEYYLRQQLKAIKKQLGDEDESELDELEHRVDTSFLSPQAESQARKQLRRLSKMQPSSNEYSVTFNYVEALLGVPWRVKTDDSYDLEAAQEILESDHYGLDKVKERLIEFLAVKQLNPNLKSPILCLVGPPGVGKTSISKSIARSLGRKFQRISLGGVRDESEIRGHRRTYVGAMPGRLVRAMTDAGTNNPVILLDEIDKIGQDFKGTPEDALLEVLDPAQNHTFSDHFLGIPLDLSNVLFIATANRLDTISAPLRDRMEIVEVPSYTLQEKKHIAKKHLLPKQIKAHGLVPKHLSISDEILTGVISKYTKEAGVRNLERRVADLCRRVAVQVARTDIRLRDSFHKEIDEDFIADVLGPVKYRSEVASRVSMPGIATGLAWTQAGGDILFVEASQMPGKGNLKLTGQLGDVMKESVEAALSFLRANAEDFDLSPSFMEDIDLHIHFPAGAIPKDGPSAGITVFSAILSVMTGNEVRNDVAMSGEISLRGQVLPVGGIREKVVAAHRAGIKHVILPSECEKDLIDVAPEVLDELEIHFVKLVEELSPLIF